MRCVACLAKRDTYEFAGEKLALVILSVIAISSAEEIVRELCDRHRLLFAKVQAEYREKELS
jgi:hypothetical protein